MIFNSVSFKNNFLTATAAGLAVMTALTVNGVHSLPSPQTGGGIAAMRLKNAQDALALDTAKTQVKLGDSCTTAAAASGVICAGDLVATCTGGVVTLMSSCSAGLKCQVLPLLNKPGTSPSCDTDSDKVARLIANGLTADQVNGAGALAETTRAATSATVSSSVSPSSTSATTDSTSDATASAAATVTITKTVTVTASNSGTNPSDSSSSSATTTAVASPTVTPTTTTTPITTTAVASPTVTPTTTATTPITTTASPAPAGSSASKGPGSHLLVGYWQNFASSQTDAQGKSVSSKNLKLSEVPSEYDIVIAFVASPVTATPGAVDFIIDSSFIPGYTLANFKTDAKTLKSSGKKLLLSIGGANVNDALVKDATSASNFAKSVIALMDDCGFDGIDIDLEHGIDVENLSSAIQTISQAKPNTIIAMAPQTVDIAKNGGYIPFINKIKSLPIQLQVNTQFYNSGSQIAFDGTSVTQGTVDFLTGQVDNLIHGDAQLDPTQVTIGLPANFLAAGDGKTDTGFVSNDVIAQALDCLVTGANCGKYTPKGKYASFGGVMGFSMNWDASAGNVFSKGVGSKLTTLKSAAV